MDPAALLLTVAPTGAETAKSDCPLPTTLAELVTVAQEAESAGAALHVHIRDDDHQPTLDPGRLQESPHFARTRLW